MKKKINRVNLYKKSKKIVVTDMVFAILGGLASVASIMETGYCGYTTITNPETLHSVPMGILCTITFAGLSTGFIMMTIGSLKNVREVLKMYRDAQKELENVSVEDEEQKVSEYCKKLDRILHSVNNNKQKN